MKSKLEVKNVRPPKPDERVNTSNAYILIEIKNLDDAAKYFADTTINDVDIDASIQVGNVEGTPENVRALKEILKLVAERF